MPSNRNLFCLRLAQIIIKKLDINFWCILKPYRLKLRHNMPTWSLFWIIFYASNPARVFRCYILCPIPTDIERRPFFHISWYRFLCYFEIKSLSNRAILRKITRPTRLLRPIFNFQNIFLRGVLTEIKCISRILYIDFQILVLWALRHM